MVRIKLLISADASTTRPLSSIIDSSRMEGLLTFTREVRETLLPQMRQVQVLGHGARGSRLFTDEWFIDDALLCSDLLALYNWLPDMTAGLTKNISVASVSGGVLWADEVNKRPFGFGGYFPDSPSSPFATWSYRTDHDTWDVVTTNSDPSYLAYGMGAVAPEAGVGHYLRGYQENQTECLDRGSAL